MGSWRGQRRKSPECHPRVSGASRGCLVAARHLTDQGCGGMMRHLHAGRGRAGCSHLLWKGVLSGGWAIVHQTTDAGWGAGGLFMGLHVQGKFRELLSTNSYLKEQSYYGDVISPKLIIFNNLNYSSSFIVVFLTHFWFLEFFLEQLLIDFPNITYPTFFSPLKYILGLYCIYVFIKINL